MHRRRSAASISTCACATACAEGVAAWRGCVCEGVAHACKLRECVEAREWGDAVEAAECAEAVEPTEPTECAEAAKGDAAVSEASERA